MVSRWTAILLGCTVVAAPLRAEEPAVTPPERAAQVNFETLKAGAPPAGWITGHSGDGSAGRWEVVTRRGAPSGARVLTQREPSSAEDRFLFAVLEEPVLEDAQVTVRCLLVGGQVDQSCGLVVRWEGAERYYVARADALEQDIRLLAVVNGKPQEVSSWHGPIELGAWHELRVRVRKEHFLVAWDGQVLIDAHNSQLAGPGRFGVWTEADAETYFDDMLVEPVPEPPAATAQPDTQPAPPLP